MQTPQLNLPGPGQRILILGRTGSGKTVAALWHLSKQDFDVRPFTIVDYKGDANINAIENIEYILPSDEPPTEPGLYVMRMDPSDTPELEQYLWNVWRDGNHGLYIDEGYMVSSSRKPSAAFRAILTQGRSKNISVILNSQRPNWIDRFNVSESDYFQVFHLNDSDDRKTIQRFLPSEHSLEERLDSYHSVYYDVSEDRAQILGPVPDVPQILETINSRLRVVQDKPEPKKVKVL